jgi:Flp pilus assembly protein TadB
MLRRSVRTKHFCSFPSKRHDFFHDSFLRYCVVSQFTFTRHSTLFPSRLTANNRLVANCYLVSYLSRSSYRNEFTLLAHKMPNFFSAMIREMSPHRLRNSGLYILIFVSFTLCAVSCQKRTESHARKNSQKIRSWKERRKNALRRESSAARTPTHKGLKERERDQLKMKITKTM